MKLIIRKPCHENWNAMTPVEKGRFCLVCSKTVKDFTKLSDDEIIQDLGINSDICVNATSEQLNRNLNYSFINSLFTKFAVGFILTSGGIVSVNAQESLTKKDTVSLNVRGEISSVSPIKKGKVKISEGFRMGAARTITGDNIPLFILDGEIINQEIFKNIDQNSIEKVEVLKGKEAMELFGSRGKNGAIFITSERQLMPRNSKISK